MSKLLAKIFKGKTTEIIDGVGHVLDRVVTNDDEKSKAKAELTEIVTSKLTEIAEFQRDVIVTEAQGTWLQRSWRPIVMLTFAAIVVISVFTETKLNDVPHHFWTLLELGVGGYIMGRSLEKTADKVTKNIDLPFIKRKNRKSEDHEKSI